MIKFSRMKFYGVLLVTGLFCASAQAAGISSTDIPEGSNWYIHVNLELIRNSEAGQQFILDTVDEVLGDIKDDLGIDIANEIHAVTIFGGELPARKGAAMSVRNIAEGLVALKALDDGDEILGETLRSIRFENAGTVLKVGVSAAADQLEALKGL